jgi:hypothetical protein
MPQAELQCHAAAEAVAVDVGLFDPQVPQQPGGVVGELLVGERAVDVGGVPMALELDGDHLAVLGQRRDETAQQLDGHVRARQHDQRVPLPVDLVVHVQPVDRGVADVVGHGPCSSRRVQP